MVLVTLREIRRISRRKFDGSPSKLPVSKKVREKYKLKESDMITFIEESGKLYLTKSTDVYWIQVGISKKFFLE
jgi:hypothetical protein